MIPEGADPELVFWIFFLLLVGMPTAAMTGWLLGGVRRRRPPKPPPGLWWLCDGCRSVNDPLNEHCYACGRVRPADPETIRTAEHFEIVQRFGGSRRDGGSAAERATQVSSPPGGTAEAAETTMAPGPGEVASGPGDATSGPGDPPVAG